MKQFLFASVLVFSTSLLLGCFGSGGGSSSSSSGASAGSCSVGGDCTPSNLSAVPASS